MQWEQTTVKGKRRRRSVKCTYSNRSNLWLLSSVERWCRPRIHSLKLTTYTTGDRKREFTAPSESDVLVLPTLPPFYWRWISRPTILPFSSYRVVLYNFRCVIVIAMRTTFEGYCLLYRLENLVLLWPSSTLVMRIWPFVFIHSSRILQTVDTGSAVVRPTCLFRLIIPRR